MEPITIENLPVETSKSGKNSFYHACPLLNRRASYAVCLHTIDAAEDDRLPETCECSPHIGRGHCDALKMRKQEEEAGRALFFQERKLASASSEKPVTLSEVLITGPSRPNDRSYMRGWSLLDGKSKSKSSMFSPPEPKKRAPKPGAETLFGTETKSLSDTVNKIAREELIGKSVTAAAAAPVASPGVAAPKSTTEPRPLMQYVAKLIRAGDNERWKLEMTRIIRKFKFDKTTQRRLIDAATTLARSSHPLDNAFIPESR
jgi:hypothetical protein